MMLVETMVVEMIDVEMIDNDVCGDNRRKWW